MPKQSRAGMRKPTYLSEGSVGAATGKGVKIPTGEVALRGANNITDFGNTAARIGTYNPERIGAATFIKMQRHFQVHAGLKLRYMPLMGTTPAVEGPDPVMAEYVRVVLSGIWRTLMRNCGKTGSARGFAPHEVVWERREGIHLVDGDRGMDQLVDGWVISKLKDLSPDNVQAIEVDGLEQFTGYKLLKPSGATLEAEKAFHFGLDMEYGNMFGTSALIAAYEPWYRQQMLWDMFMRYMERRAIPPTLVEYPAGTDETDQTPNWEKARALASGITTDDVAMWVPSSPEGEPKWDVRFIEDSQRSQMYLEALNAHNTWILRGLLVPDTFFTQTQDTGSLALSQTHAEAYMMMLDGLLGDVVEAVQNQLVPRIVRYTFGPDAPVPTLTVSRFSDDMRAYLGELLKVAMQSGNAGISVVKIADLLGVPLEDDESAAPDQDADDDTQGGGGDAMLSGIDWKAAAVEIRELAHDLRLAMAAEG